MGSPIPHDERRAQIRHPLTGDLTGAMYAAATGSLVPCIAVDVSKNGLKIILSLDLAPGTALILRMLGRERALTVSWCGKEPTRKGYFACGLKTATPDVDLLALFADAGWLSAAR